MNGLQVTGAVLAALGCLSALAFAFVPDVALGGSTGGGGPSGTIRVDFGPVMWVGLLVAAIGVGLVFAGRPRQA